MGNRYPKVHADLQEIAKKAPVFKFTKISAWFIRKAMVLLPVSKPPENVLIENTFITRQDDGARIRLRIYKSKSADRPAPVLLWLHGGGYIIGRPEMDDHFCNEYASELGITVVSVDYRYAPKHPYPTGLQDSYAALQWVVSNAEYLGIDVHRIAIGGSSAGGGLAAALTQYTHDQQEIKPVFQLLIYPMLDDRTVLRTDIDDSNGVLWNQKSNRFGWESYLQTTCGARNVPAYAVPARREDLSGLPPAWIGVGTVDIFRDEDAAYARRLMDHGVACELITVPGAFHGFDSIDTHIPIVQEFRKSQRSALKKYLF